jgi:hypothetical protein
VLATPPGNCLHGYTPFRSTTKVPTEDLRSPIDVSPEARDTAGSMCAQRNVENVKIVGVDDC